MADTPSSRNIRVVVLTTPKYDFLLAGFLKRFKKYWPERGLTIWSHEGSWSNGVIDMVETMGDEIMIILHEDFYFHKEVNETLLDRIIKYTVDNPQVGRFGLCGAHTPTRVFPQDGFFRHSSKAEYLCSFEASIFRREYLKRVLGPNENPWQGELNSSMRARGERDWVMWSQHPALFYSDAMRRGQLQPIGTL